MLISTVVPDLEVPRGAVRVVDYLGKIFPLRYWQEALQARDVRIWMQQELVQIAFSVLGVLAGVNRVYFFSVPTETDAGIRAAIPICAR